MKEFISSIFKTSEERIKNPFLGSFIVSWIVFNWKPIFLVIFSNQTAESKIDYIELCYSNFSNLVIYPLLAAIFYVILLPYLDLVIQGLVRFSVLERNKIIQTNKKQEIENQLEISIERIKLEESQKAFRERRANNEIVESLENKIAQLELERKKIDDKNIEYIESLKKDFDKKENLLKSELSGISEELYQVMEKNSTDSKLLREKEMMIKQFSDSYGKNSKSGFKSELRSILTFENGIKVLEENLEGNYWYYDLLTDKVIDRKQIEKLKLNHKYNKRMVS